MNKLSYAAALLVVAAPASAHAQSAPTQPKPSAYMDGSSWGTWKGPQPDAALLAKAAQELVMAFSINPDGNLVKSCQKSDTRYPLWFQSVDKAGRSFHGGITCDELHTILDAMPSEARGMTEDGPTPDEARKTKIDDQNALIKRVLDTVVRAKR